MTLQKMRGHIGQTCGWLRKRRGWVCPGIDDDKVLIDVDEKGGRTWWGELPAGWPPPIAIGSF